MPRSVPLRPHTVPRQVQQTFSLKPEESARGAVRTVWFDPAVTWGLSKRGEKKPTNARRDPVDDENAQVAWLNARPPLTQGLPLHLHTTFYRKLYPFHFSLNTQPSPSARPEICEQTKKTDFTLNLTLTVIRNTYPGHKRERTHTGAPEVEGGLRILLPGRQRTLPGRRRARRKCGLLAAAVFGRAEGGSRGWGAGLGWRQQRPGQELGRPRRSSSRRRYWASSSTTRASGRARER